MPNLVGHKLGKYELVERLGHGGMAEVYKAFQPGLERFVACKVLHCHLSNADSFVARFQREARAIGRLHHPHIMRVIDFDVEDELYYMVMDYIQGGTLGDSLKAKQLFTVNEALRIGGQVADALTYAHGQGMIHRDIKPGNIMFLDEQHRQVVLTDFGLVHLRDELDGALTLSGALIGTPTYMSPEAVRGEPCDARSDIYSLGVVLYEMVTGKPPYAVDTPYRMMMKQANEPLPLPRTLNPKLPVMVERLLLNALGKDPAARYQTTAEFVDAIQQVRADCEQEEVLPVAPLIVNPAQVTPKRKRTPFRVRWVMAFTTFGALLIALLTTLLLVYF